MRYWLSLTLAAFAAASLAGCAGVPTSKSNDYIFARTTGGPDCRRLAQPGDTKIRIYCKNSAPSKIWAIAPATSQPAGDMSCRRLATSIEGPVKTYCGTTARWDEFDTRAIKAGVTCRWVGYNHRLARAAGEVCLDGSQWTRAEANSRSRTPASQPGFAYSGNSGWTSPSNSSALDATAGSYGPFPSGGAIGQTFH